MDRIDVAVGDYSKKNFQTLLNDVIQKTDRKKFPPTNSQILYLKLVAQRHGVKIPGGGGEPTRIVTRRAKKSESGNVYVQIEEKTTRTRGKRLVPYTRTVSVHERKRRDGSIYLQYRNPKTGAYIKKPRWVD